MRRRTVSLTDEATDVFDRLARQNVADDLSASRPVDSETVAGERVRV
jgi:hypothetical protein